MRSFLLAAVLGAAGVRAQSNIIAEADCQLPSRRWACQPGCYDPESTNCTASVDGNAMTESLCRATNSIFTWNSTCNCFCQEKVCDYGCWDMEDEMCLKDTNEMGCAEIYGHVEWSKKCNCRFGNDDVVIGQEKQNVNLYFSVPAFVVLFRESLEVVIVLVIIIQFLNKSMQDGIITPEMFYRFRREVYVGASVGFCMCLILGVGFLVLASQFRSLFKGDNLRIFDGIMMILTSVVLSFLALNFYKMIHTKEGHERKMKEKIESTVQASKEAEEQGTNAFGRKHAFLVLAFTTGLREGLESIIFLIGVVSDVKDLSSLPLPIVTALVLARLVGCCFFQGTKKMRVDWFMRASAMILTFIAAGFFSQSMHKIQELGGFGTWSPRAERRWQNQEVYDASGCCSDKTNRFFVLMRAMIGWQDKPTPIEFFAYAFYWIAACILGFVCIRRAKRQMDLKVQEWRKEEQETKGGRKDPGVEEDTVQGGAGGAEPTNV